MSFNISARGAVSWILVAAILNGCSAFVPEQEEVKITASQPGADIYVNNDLVGQSPLVVKLARNDSYTISSSSDPLPYEDNRRISFTGALDIVGAFLFVVPLIGCFTPGFWTIGDTDVHLKTATQVDIPAAQN
jgi:hypothetical protein